MTDRLTQLRALRDQITREIHALERRYGRPESPDDDAQRLIALTAARHGVTVDDVLSPSRRRDADNLLALLKPCLDALVQEGILKDDSFRYVPAVTCAIHEGNGEPASMWLILNEIPALVCAFALHRGAFCGRPAGHDGDHLPAGVEQ